MRTKYLEIGFCLCAIVLLVMGSLSNVVGYQSVKSTTVNDSPLFQTRTQKAINKENNILPSNYLGKDRNTLSFPLRDTNEELIQKYIEKIRTMDEITFNRFINYAVNQIKHKDNLKDINIKEVITGLHQVKDSKQNIIVYKDPKDDRRTYFYNFVPTACWIPGCVILTIILIAYLFYWLYELGPTYLYPIPCGI
jgi:hypothetical protein